MEIRIYGASLLGAIQVARINKPYIMTVTSFLLEEFDLYAIFDAAKLSVVEVVVTWPSETFLKGLPRELLEWVRLDKEADFGMTRLLIGECQRRERKVDFFCNHAQLGN